MARARRLYRALLRLYPAGFREEYEGPMERQFSDEYRDIGTRPERARFWLRALADLAVSVPAELLREFGRDLIYAARIYRRRLLVTVLAATALALATGASTAVFSVVNAVLLRSLPFREPERLVQIARFEFLAIEYTKQSVLRQWRDQNPYLQDFAVYRTASMNLTRAGQAVWTRVTESTAGFFPTLGVNPELGRSFTADEETAGKGRVAVISHAVWQERFGGDPRILGATIRLNGVPLTVVGVAPRGFEYPDKTDAWTPSYFDDSLPRGFGTTWGLTGRLKPGFSLSQANAMYLANLRHASPHALDGEPANRPRLISLQDHLAGKLRQASLVLMAAVMFVLLIACANVAQLLLTRATERRPELAIRTALGASRARLVQQLILESMALTLAGAAFGLAIAKWLAGLAAVAQPAALSTQDYSILDWRVLGFAAGLAVLTAVVFGILPALLIGRFEPGCGCLRTHAGADIRVKRTRGALVAFEIALSVVLVAGSLVMGGTFRKLAGTDLGFRTGNAVTLTTSLYGTPYEDDVKAAQYFGRALDSLRAMPGVESAGAADFLPLVSHGWYVSGPKLDSGQTVNGIIPITISPGYFHTIGAGIMAGRDFSDADTMSTAPVAIINQEFVRLAGAGSGLVGRKVKSLWAPPFDKPLTIVGVVRNTRFYPGMPVRGELYVALAQCSSQYATFVARVRGQPESYLAASRNALRRVDPQVPVYDVKTLDGRLREHLAKPRFYTIAVLFFGAVALLLAMIGTYGVAAHSVAQRTHEIGVRIAVGGSPGRVRRMLIWQAMRPVVVGLAAGAAGASGAGRFLNHLIAGAEPVGAAGCAAAAGALALTAAAAIWIATGRVVRMDATAALRTE